MNVSQGIRVLKFGLIMSAICLIPDFAMAASTGGGGTGGLPWETPLQTLSNSIKGPVAYAISLMGIVAAGAMLIWGGEINEFVRRIIMLILVISLIIFASNILTTLFNSGATI